VLTGLAAAVRIDVFQAKVWSALARARPPSLSTTLRRASGS